MSETQTAQAKLVQADFTVAGEGEAKNAPVLAQGERRQRPAPNGHSLPVGRPKGVPNKLTQTLKEAVEKAARDCHPQGLAGWLVERAQGGVQDRAIFAGLVGKVIPIQVNQSVSGGVSINLNWLGSRSIGTVSAQPKVIDAQTIDLIEDSGARHWTADGMQGQQQAADAQSPAGGDGLQGLQSAQAQGGYPALDQQAIASPAPDTQAPGASPRGADLDPPSPPKAGAGGPAEAGAPS